MKKTLLFAMLMFALFLSGCGNSKSSSDKEDTEEKKKTDDENGDTQSDPEQVLKAVFKAAKSGDYTGLSDLCDAEGDGDVKRICDIENQTEAKQEEFNSYFKTGKIVGEPEIEGSDAKVKFTFGPEGDKDEEMNMVKKNGKWYLSSF